MEVAMNKNLVSIKGTSSGLVFTFNRENATFKEICLALEDKLMNSGDFFVHAEYIIAEICGGFNEQSKYKIIKDRREAIEYAICNSQKGDIILLAGKGHETYQLICGVRESFSEAEIVAEFCENYLSKN